MKSTIKYAMPLAAAILLVGCGGSSSNSKKDDLDLGGLTTTSLKFTSTATWSVTPTAGESICFDFDKNADVECTGTAWDIKLSLGTGARDSAQFFTNSGPLATGKGGSLGDPFNFSWAELKAMKDTSTSPDGDPLLSPMFITDSMDNAFASDNPFGGTVFEYADQAILPKLSVFLVTTDNTEAYSDTSDNVYAIQISKYKNAAGVSGHPTIRYVKVSDVTASGANATVTEKTVDASANWVYLNLETGATTTNKSGAWHLGFNRYNIITNSGNAGTGKVGTFEAQKYADFFEDDEVVIDNVANMTPTQRTEAEAMLTDAEGWNTPAAASNWKKDTLKSALNPAYKGSPFTGIDYGFYLYTGMSDHPAGQHKFVANPDNGVLLRSGEGNSYARVHLSSITDDLYTFDFDVAPAK